MLLELEIRDFALIEHLTVSFTAGLNVLTGETGAGKSILMDALNTVLGGRASLASIRTDSARAIIEASFKTSPDLCLWLKEQQLAGDEEDRLVVSREISRSGSKSRINGSLVNMAILQDLRQHLVSVHAQHESRTLLSSQMQLELLDNIAGAEHKKVLGRFKTAYASYQHLLQEYAGFEESEAERQRRIDFISFQLRELEEAQIEDSQEDLLVGRQRKVLMHKADLELLLANAQVYLKGHDLEGEAGAIDLIEKAGSELEKASALDPSLSPVASGLAEALDRLEQEAKAIRKYCQMLEPDPETLLQLDERAATLAAIKRKYGPTLSDAMNLQQQLQNELEGLSNYAAGLKDLAGELEKAKVELLEAALELSKRRQSLASELAAQIESELAQLNMAACQFEIAFKQNSDEDILSAIGASGLDRIEFLISPNPGQPLMPLAKIASGGELSRVMLAVKTIFAPAEKVPTVIFDEIDTGLSGGVLQTLRDKLSRLSCAQQIICITHQALIASIADNHLFVYKEQEDGKTRSRLLSLQKEEEQVERLAQMAAGQASADEAARGFAQLLIEEARQVKSSFER